MADTFNGLTQHFEPQPLSSQPQQNTSLEHPAPATAGHSDADSHYVPRPKRIACVLCRRRKLRCDGKRPSCGTCSRLGHECIYDEVRKKSGPKRGYVKQLEARLAQVETLLKSQGNGSGPSATNELVSRTPSQDDVDASMSLLDRVTASTLSTQASSRTERTGLAGAGGELISLGLEEPLPTQEVIDELNALYFEKIHPGTPMIHRPRYLAAMALAPSSRPPVCLQYMIWSHAASVSDKHSELHGIFYQRARKHAELDELKGLGERVVSLAHCQTWLLISTYEFKMMFFPRAWLSSGKSSRLAIMMGLNRLDGQGLDVKQTLPPPKDFTEKEERRRVFWMAFCVDRYASIGTGWPFTIDERDISSKLPASDESFTENKPQQTPLLPDVIAGEDITMLSPFGGVVVLGCMFGRNISHLHRPEPQDNDHDLNGLYWQRHRSLDNTLLHISLAMPSHLRLTVGTTDPNVIFCNMAIHTATICLHQAAIYKSEKNKMPEQIATESKRRCIVAADQTSNIMKMISHLDLSVMNPFMSFCVYLAARVFIQYLKFRPSDSAARSSLRFAFSALHALKVKNPLAGSFILQLNLDIEGSAFGDGLDSKTTCFTGPQHVTTCTNKDTANISSPENISQYDAQVEGISPDVSQGTSGNTIHTPSSLSSRQNATEILSDIVSTTAAGNAQKRTHSSTSDRNLRTKGSRPGTDPATNISPGSNDSSDNPPVNPISSQLNPSFNPPFMGPNYAHPPQQSQQATRHSPLQPYFYSFGTLAPVQYTDVPFPRQAASLGSTDPETPLSNQAAWDIANNTASGLNNGNPDNASNGFEALNDAQWAQLLSSTDWETWQGLNMIP